MRFACPHCDQHLDCDARHAGALIKCPGCSGEMLIPELPDSHEETAQSEESLQTLNETLQSNVSRGDMTISKFMSRQQMSGGVDLSGDATHTATSFLTAEQGRKYKLGKVVAQGGMGAIVDAKDLNVRRSVAMKVLLKPDEATREEILRFIEEAQVMGQLAHPSIVPLYELGVDASGNVYYTMKFVKGVTLKDILKSISEDHRKTTREYPLNRLLSIFLRICDAIAFAHSKGVIHRDLKPDNIMIGEYGEVLVIDWGLAKVLARGQESGDRSQGEKKDIKEIIDSVRKDTTIDVMNTMDGDIMGTPGFMSPEQAMGEADLLDERTDIYSLGAILYNIMTLSSPIERGDLGDMLDRITSGTIIHPSAYNPTKRGPRTTDHRPPDEAGSDEAIIPKAELKHMPGRSIPDALAGIAMKALATEAKDRYASVKDLQKDVEAFQGGFATSVEEMNVWKHFKLLVRRHRAVTLAVGFSTAIVLIAVGTSFFQTRAALRRLKDTAPTFYTLAQEQVAQQKFTEALKNVDHAISLVPTEAKYHNQRGNILQSLLKMDAAAEAYATTLQIEPKFPFARTNLVLSAQISKENAGRDKVLPASVGRLIAAMRKQERYPEVITLSRRLEDGTATLTDALKQMLAKAKLPSNGLVVNADGTVRLSLSQLRTDNISALEGMPLTTLNITTCAKLSDLAPLKAMPLESLNLTDCPKVSSLSALQELPLKQLHIAGTAAEDLSPLADMPLESLTLAQKTSSGAWHKSRVSDLSPLAKTPLKHITLVPDQVIAGMDSLRKIRSLERINGETPGSFFKKVDDGLFFAGAQFRAQIEKAWPGATRYLQKAEGKTLSLSLHRRTDVVDLTPLKDVPLSSLNVSECRELTTLAGIEGAPLKTLNLSRCPKLTDLAPLQGIRLESIDLSGCGAVSNLAPLQAAALTQINLSGTAAEDISPLKKMRVSSLMLAQRDSRGTWGASRVRDLTPAARLPLKQLTCVPDQIVAGMDQVRRIRTLERINTEVPAEFFKKFDKGEFFAGAQFRERMEKAWPGSTRGLSKAEGKTLNLSLRNRKDVIDLTPLKGVPLASLDLGDCRELKSLAGIEGAPLKSLIMTNCGKVTDLHPLKGMKLISLDLTSCTGIRDLTHLKGIPLESLGLLNCREVKDLSPLKGKTLTSLTIAGTAVKDLSPLIGSPLKSLTLCHDRSASLVADLAPVRGMPLETLNLAGFYSGNPASSCAVTDLSPLSGRKLKSLTLQPENIVTGIDAIRNMNTLTRINNGGVTAFWKRYDGGDFFAGAQFRDRMEKVWPGSTRNLRKSGGKTLTLSLRNRRDVIDLTPLEGVPLVSLDLYDCRALESLSGIEGSPLKKLDLGNCGKIKSLEPLKGLALESLNLRSCSAIESLAPLQGKQLKTLDLLVCGKIKDLSPLQGMKLEALTLAGTAVTDLSPLVGAPLRALTLCHDRYGCPVADLTPLSKLPLETLHLAGLYSTSVRSACPATDLSPLAGRQLKTLSLKPEQIVNGIQVIRGMKTLTRINNGAADAFWKQYDAGEFFAGAQFKEALEKVWPDAGLGFQKTKGKLLKLSLRDRKDVMDLSPLKGLPLIELDLTGCTQLTDLRGIEKLPLEVLNLQNCGNLKNIAPLQQLKLKSLILAGTAVEDLAPLAKLPLNTFTCGANVSSLAPLSGRPLKTLDLSNCKKVEDLGPLQGMRSLRTLKIGVTGVIDLSPLKGLQIEHLYMHTGYGGCGVDDLTPLKDLRKLKTLSLYKCSRIRDLSPLRDLPITNIDTRNCNITDKNTALRAMKRLRTIDTIPAKDYWTRVNAAKNSKK